jgi:hypothetical protein
MKQPASIYEGVALPDGERVFSAYDFGVPKAAKAICLSAFMHAPANVGTMLLLIYQERATRNKKWGFGVSCTSLSWAMGQGTVPLGEGAYAGKFVVKTYQGRFDEANLFIVGYYV